jgi:ribosomal-protein-alanine N-acetyltransferase
MTKNICKDIIIRPMQEEDIPLAQAIDKISYALPWPENAFQVEFDNKDVSYQWVAEGSLPDGKKWMAGMIVVWLILDEAHIATLAVHPDDRRCGIGRKLLGYALLGLLEKGAEKAFLEVRSGNEPAKAIYTKFGFSVTAVRSRYYQDNHEDALLMTLEPLVAKQIKKAARIN